jgi:hypothetical protein
MIETNPFWRKLTKPIRDSVINHVIESMPVDKLIPWDKEFTFAERLLPKNTLLSKFPAWVSSHFTGFDKLSFRYVCNGNTDSLNHIFMQGKFDRVFTLDNEYTYYGYLCQELGKEKVIFNLDTIEQITPRDLVCISLPSAYNGSVDDRTAIISILQKNNIPVYIDVAYCGLTEPFLVNIRPTSNTYFAFSFSKTLAVGFNRISVVYSGSAISGLDIMNKIGYVNISGINIVNTLMKQLPCDYIYNTYKDQYLPICDRLGLTPTKTILVAHDTNKQKYCITDQYEIL